MLSLAAALLTASCDDNESTIGSTLITNKGEVVIDSTYTVGAQSLPATVMRSRTISQLLGNIDAKGYGRLSSNFVTQFMPTSVLDTAGMTGADVDSLRLIFRFRGQDITGDSLVPMGLTVYELTKQLPYEIYSDFDPEGYYNPSEIFGSSIYTGNAMYDDDLSVLDTHVISVPLPLEKGRELFDTFRAQPSLFQTPESFASIFPGVYVKSTFGSGRVTNIYNTRLAIYYHHHTTYYNTNLKQERDTTYYYARVMAAASPEAVSNNCLDFKVSSNLSDRVANGEALLVSPLGYNARIHLPMADIVKSYKTTSGPMAVINTMIFRLPVDSIPNTYGIKPPSQLLMVQEDLFEGFFEGFKIPDNRTSFLLTYSRYTGSYMLNDMRGYFLELLKADAPDIEKRSTFVLVPVATQTESYQPSYYSPSVTMVTNVLPEVSTPAMAKIQPDSAKIVLTYSRETINN